MLTLHLDLRGYDFSRSHCVPVHRAVPVASTNSVVDWNSHVCLRPNRGQFHYRRKSCISSKSNDTRNNLVTYRLEYWSSFRVSFTELEHVSRSYLYPLILSLIPEPK